MFNVFTTPAAAPVGPRTTKARDFIEELSKLDLRLDLISSEYEDEAFDAEGPNDRALERNAYTRAAARIDAAALEINAAICILRKAYL